MPQHDEVITTCPYSGVQHVESWPHKPRLSAIDRVRIRDAQLRDCERNCKPEAAHAAPASHGATVELSPADVLALKLELESRKEPQS